MSNEPSPDWQSVVANTSEAISSCLLFEGTESESSGTYRPLAYELRLRGESIVQHHITHLHEIHHKVLNDDTAWGSLIHIAARHPDWEGLLSGLIGNCRLVHEAFASFMAASLAEQRHTNVDDVLDRYPVYRPLVGRMRRLLSPVPSGHRQDLAATGIARFCMSPPVLDLVIARYPEPITLADVPSSWLPDQRFAIISGVRSESIRDACAEADAGFVRGQGRTFESLGLDETDSRLDDSWNVWETAFMAHLIAAEPRVRSLPRVDANEHLPAAANVIRAATLQGVKIPLPHEPDDDAISDAESVQRLLTTTEVMLRPSPRPGALAKLGRDVSVEEVLGLCASGPRPFLIVHGRMAAHLRTSFSLGPRDLEFLQASAEPIFAVRVLLEHDQSDLVLNATMPSPSAYRELVQSWSDQHVAANCITASCFVRTDWQRSWLPELSRTPTVVLVDMGLLGMVGAGSLLGAEGLVHGIYLGLGDPTLEALAVHVEDHPHVLLILGDDLTVQLFAGQLADLLGDRLVMREADWSEWLPTLSAVSASIVGTEYSLRYDGMGRA